jgi:hypothetical protein
MSTAKITFELPAAGDSPFIFRRRFLGAIRDAIAHAQINGEVDAEIAVECFKSLPMPDVPK